MGLVMLEVLYIVARLLLIAILLALIGKPLWLLYSKIFGSSLKLNFVQELVIDICFGGFVLYILAVIPLGFFNHLVLSAILIFCSSVSIYLIVAKSNLAKNKKLKFHVNRSNLLDQILTLSLFLIALLIQCVPLTNFTFGSIHDTSLHALFTQLIIENQGIPETHQPYMSAAVVFPQGAHPIFAFAALLAAMIPPLAVFHVTALFNALAVLAAYHYGKEFTRFKWGGLSLAFMVALISMWPAFVTWGSNTFVIAFSYLLVALTMLKWIQNTKRFKKWRQVSVLTAVGAFLGYLATVHLSLFWLLIATWGIHEIVKRKITIRISLEQIARIFLLLFITSLPILPFFIRFAKYYNLPGHNIGLPTDVGDVINSPLTIGSPPPTFADIKGVLLTLFSRVNISPYTVPRFIFIGLSVLGIVLLIRLTLKRRSVSEGEIVPAIMIGASILLILVQALIPETALILGRYGRFALLLYFSFILLFGALNFRFYRKCKLLILKIRPSLNSTKLGSLIVLLMMFVPIYSPFLYYRFAKDPTLILDNYGVYAVTGEDDYDLMVWMEDNLSMNACILINPFEPGLLIPSISHKKIIYPLSGYHLSQGYAEVARLLSNGILNQTVYQYLLDLNITHIYVGTKNSGLTHEGFNKTKWDPYLFLGNPNFYLVKRCGNAYLFGFLYRDPQLIFLDSFENPDVSSIGWNLASHKASESSAINDFSIVSENSFEGKYSARITAKSSGTPCWTSIHRQIYTAQPLNISISFYLKPTHGFGHQDDLMLIVSDAYWQNQIYFRTRNLGVKCNPIFLPNSGGYFEFNLSELWQRVCNQSLPETFFIQFINYDADGVENVAYIDTVAVGCRIEHFFSSYNAIHHDDFEYPGLLLDDWRFYALKEEGNGFGSIEITDSYAYYGRYSLLTSAQTVTHRYWCSAIKTVNLYQNASSVTLSLFLAQVEGFGDSDGLMIIFSDGMWRQKIVMTTNRMLPIRSPSVLISAYEEYFEFNLTKIWKTMLGSSLPETFFVQIVNYDSDGIKNIAYIDDVEIKIR